MLPSQPRTGAPELTLAIDQPEYIPLTVALYEDTEFPWAKIMLSRWTPNDEERLQLGWPAFRKLLGEIGISLEGMLDENTAKQLMKVIWELVKVHEAKYGEGEDIYVSQTLRKEDLFAPTQVTVGQRHWKVPDA